MTKRELTPIDKIAIKTTEWIGSSSSIIIHSLFFLGSFTLPFFGVDFDQILLIITTAVSLEAIYLAIFIQMTVNRNTESLHEVELDIDEIQEDIDEIQEDVDDIIEEEEKDNIESKATTKALADVQAKIENLLKDIDKIKRG